MCIYCIYQYCLSTTGERLPGENVDVFEGGVVTANQLGAKQYLLQNNARVVEYKPYNLKNGMLTENASFEYK